MPKLVPSLHRARERIEHRRRRVAEHERAPRQHVVDVLVAIDVPDARAFAARHDERLAADAAERAHRRVHARRETARATAP